MYIYIYIYIIIVYLRSEFEYILPYYILFISHTYQKKFNDRLRIIL